MKLTKDSVVYYDGAFHYFERIQSDLATGYFGAGHYIFDMVRAYQAHGATMLFKPWDHAQRFLNSANRMKFALPVKAEDLVTIWRDLLRLNNQKEALIKPVLFDNPTKGVNRPTLFVASMTPPPGMYNYQMRLKVSTQQKPNPKVQQVGIKVSDYYTENLVARREALSQGFDDALILDEHGFVADTYCANIFFEKDDVLYTPSGSHILQGITRRTIIDIARQDGIEVVEKKISPEEIAQADGAFLTGTTLQVKGIRSIDKRPLGLDWEETLGHRLAMKYLQLVTHDSDDSYALI